jgi:putative membrane protein
MIPDYVAHAANERTYLAWIRTAITIMTLGFFLEKFELYLARLHAHVSDQPGSQPGVQLVGVLLVVLGILILIAGTYRFDAVRRKLEADVERRYSGLGFALVLSSSLGLLGVVLLLDLLRLF